MKYDFPKIDLHLHLDGSLNPESAWEMAKERGLEIAGEPLEEFRRRMVVGPEIKSLYEFLEKFDLPTAILQDTEALERAAFELTVRLAGQGLVYAEIRFAPQLHTQKGCTQKEIVQAVIRGAERGMKECPAIRVGIILCAMTLGSYEENKEANLETLALTGEFLGRGVAAFDIAGAENVVPMKSHAPLFERARSMKLPFTIHAGEVECAEDVRTAISFGARRIGHGHHCVDDPEILQLVLDTQIPLEICITSNIQCKNQPSYEAHPLKKLYDLGAKVTMNTDNMVLSNVTLDSEYEIAGRVFGFQRRDFIQLNRNSAEAAFLPPEEKQRYLDMLVAAAWETGKER